ncbi:hypothetical protein EBU71_22645, partial [bacterium]|nr:hypothetical protein [Candidatus Elulimicrobium humile]
MRHKIYLNIQSFVTDLILNILLYGKYTLIESSLDLNFHRRFISMDEYLTWATKQVIIDLQKYTKLLAEDVNIQDLYLIMDQTRSNDDVIFDIEQLIRYIVPFSLYMESKDMIYESYFELIECYLEELILNRTYAEFENPVEPEKLPILSESLEQILSRPQTPLDEPEHLEMSSNSPPKSPSLSDFLKNHQAETPESLLPETITESRLFEPKPESLKPESLKPESLKPESLKPESLKP